MTNLAEGLFLGRQRTTIDDNWTETQNRSIPNRVLDRHRCTILFCLVLWKLIFCHNSDKSIKSTGSYKMVSSAFIIVV